MNTPTHLIFGATAFARPDRKGTLPAALAASLAPDVSLFVMVAVSLWLLDVPARTVFDEYYYSDAWQSIFAVDNSFILWGALLAFALWQRIQLLTAFAGAGFLQLAFDFPLHTHDARMHFLAGERLGIRKPLQLLGQRRPRRCHRAVDASNDAVSGALSRHPIPNSCSAGVSGFAGGRGIDELRRLEVRLLRPSDPDSA